MEKKNEERKNEISLKKNEDGKLIKPDFQRNKLFKKGVHLMADEKLEEAARTFEMILRTDPNDVEALLKLGYSRFHLDDFSESIKSYDRVLDIDITNQEAWNLKSLVHYEKKSYAKALDCVEKSIDSVVDAFLNNRDSLAKDINTSLLEDLISSDIYIKKAEVYLDLRNNLLDGENEYFNYVEKIEEYKNMNIILIKR